MKKILENSGIKLIVIIVFSLSMLGTLISGIAVVCVVRNNNGVAEQEEAVRNNILDNICYGYEQKSLEWYDLRAGGEYSLRDEEYYQQLFSEKNCNFYFQIEPNNQKDKEKFPVLSNYTGEDYQYAYSTIVKESIPGDTIGYGYNLTLEDFCDGNGEVYVYDYAALVERYNLTDMSEENESEEMTVGKTTTSEYFEETEEETDETTFEENYYTDEPVYGQSEISGNEKYMDAYDITDSVSLEYYDGELLEQAIGVDDNYYSGYLLGDEKEELLRKADVSQEDIIDISCYVSGDNGIPYIVLQFDAFQIEYNLWNNAKFRKDLYTFLKNEVLSRYNYYELYDYAYDRYSNELYMEYRCSNVVELKYSGYVKSNFTALDNFSSSFGLKIIPFIFNGAVPIFAISVTLWIASAVYIIMAAGRKKNYEGVYINTFNSIPFDVILIAYGFICYLEMCLINNIGIRLGTSLPDFFYDFIFNSYYGSSWLGKGFAIFLLVLPVAFATAALISTTSARLKTGDVLKNTIVVRCIKCLYRLMKKVCKKTRKLLSYLRTNASIYIKWLGGFIAISVVEFAMGAAALDIDMIAFLWIVERIILIILLIVAITNMNKLKKGAQIIAAGQSEYEVDTDNMLWEFKKHGENLNQIRDGIQVAVDDRLKSEKMKTELITNVSHDIKTPLTSIINYVDLLSKEELNNSKADEYIEVLRRQSAKLKKLIQDLIDASKASTGNMPVELVKMDVRVLLEQIIGELEEKLRDKGMKIVSGYHTDNTMVMADGKHMWRVFDNLMVNILKYGQENTRVYIDVEDGDLTRESDGFTRVEPMIKISIKNISREELNITGEELMERFVRGDSSRNTDGSGLGLSIARSLMDIQGGKLQIIVDGDLFKVVLLLVKA